MAKKKAPWVGPLNPADANTGVLKPTNELTSEARAESEKMSPRPVVVPKDKKTTTERKVTKIDPKTNTTYEKAEHLKDYKEPVQKRKQAKIVTAQKLKAAGVRPAKNTELKKGVVAVTVGETKPTRIRKPRTKTKTGKKIDLKTGQIALPKKGQAAKVDGKVVRVDATNIEEAQRQAKTTVLPTAGPEASKPNYELPGAPQTVKEQGYSQSSPEHHERLKQLTGKAFLHLGRMQSTHGTDEYHSHHADFNETHAHVSQLDHSLGEILKTAHTAASNPSHPDSSKQFAYAKQAAGERLGLGKKTMDARTERSQAGRAKRMERIRAEQAAKEGQ